VAELCKHPERKTKSRGLCASCYNAWLINRDPETRAKVLANNRANWTKRYSARNSAQHAKEQKNRVLLHRYGIDHDTYDQMHVAQQNRCAICDAEGGNTKSTRLYVDHNHASGAVRQLLCPGCNQAVGIIEQGITRVSALAAYLYKHEPDSEAWNALAKLDLAMRKAEKITVDQQP